MSSAHHHRHSLTRSDLDALLDEVLADTKIQARLHRPFSLNTDYDIALLGSSSIGGRTVYLDRHLRHADWAYGVLPVQGKRLDVKPGLVRHERLEQALEDVFGWGYAKLAHPVAQRYEERDYERRGFDPRKVETAFSRYIKSDEREKIVKSPTDLDLRPMLQPPDWKLIERVNDAAQKEKKSHEDVGYVEHSNRGKQKCGKCVMFIEPKYGGPGCTLVKSPVVAPGYCRRFAAGRLDGLPARRAVGGRVGYDEGGEVVPAVTNDPLIRPPSPLMWPATTAPARAAAQAIYDVGKGVGTLPQRAFQASEERRLGGDYDPAPVVEAAMLPMGAAAPFAERGAAGIFGGKLAATADQAALARAQEMAAKGASREDIWNSTGWFQGADKEWRFEIPDQAAAMKNVTFPQHRLEMAQDIFAGMGLPRYGFANPKYSAETKKALDAADEMLKFRGAEDLPLSEHMAHEDLYAAYPSVAQTPTMKHQTFGFKGSFAPGEEPHISYTDTIGGNRNTLGTVLHETQHAVQNVEGFATGANTFGLRPNTPAWNIYQERLQAIRDSGKISREEFSKRAGYEGLAPKKDYDDFVKQTRRISPTIDRAAQEYAVQEAYRRAAGEVEARNVQARMNMTPAQRKARPPWVTEDVPSEQQILKYNKP